VSHAATVFLDWVHVDPIMLTRNIPWRFEFSMFGHSWSFLYLLTCGLSVNVSGWWLHIWHFMALQGVTQFWAKEVVLQVTAHALPFFGHNAHVSWTTRPRSKNGRRKNLGRRRKMRYRPNSEGLVSIASLLTGKNINQGKHNLENNLYFLREPALVCPNLL
jgi:hypothetical protein